MSRKSRLGIRREDLVIGDFYYLYDGIRRFKPLSDYVSLWRTGPSAFVFPNPGWDIEIEKIWMNEHNPFVFLDSWNDEDSNNWWYHVLTKTGNMGWFCIDIEDMELFQIEFRRAIIPDDKE